MNFIRKQQGFLLILAAVLIVIVGIYGITQLFLITSITRVAAELPAANQTFYLAESGIERAKHALWYPSYDTVRRTACSAITGNANFTNYAFGTGAYTVTASPKFFTTTTNLAINNNNTDTTVRVVGTGLTNFPTSGRIMINREVMSYNGLSGVGLPTLILRGVKRALDGSKFSAHASGAGVGVYQCQVTSTGGVPNLTAPMATRQITQNVLMNEGYAVGNVTGGTYNVRRWNRPTENVWNDATFTSGVAVNLNSVSMLSSADGFAVADASAGKSTVARWNGTSWTVATPINACSATQNLLGISAVSSQSAFAVGVRTCEGVGPNYTHNVVRWNGTVWSRLTGANIPVAAPTRQTLNAVHVIDTNGDGIGDFGLAVGNAGQNLMLGPPAVTPNWTLLNTPHPTQNLRGVFVVSLNQIWAVGTGGVIERCTLVGGLYDCAAMPSPTTQQLNSVVMLDTNGDGLADIGYAVGNGGIILEYSQVNGWVLTPLNYFGTGTTNDLLSVDMINQDIVMAVGVGPVAVFRDPTTFLKSNQPFNNPSQEFNAQQWRFSLQAGGGQWNSISLIGPRNALPQKYGWTEVIN